MYNTNVSQTHFHNPSSQHLKLHNRITPLLPSEIPFALSIYQQALEATRLSKYSHQLYKLGIQSKLETQRRMQRWFLLSDSSIWSTCVGSWTCLHISQFHSSTTHIHLFRPLPSRVVSRVVGGVIGKKTYYCIWPTPGPWQGLSWSISFAPLNWDLDIDLREGPWPAIVKYVWGDSSRVLGINC